MATLYGHLIPRRVDGHLLHLLYPRIKEICITCEFTIGGEPVLAVNPIRKNIFL